MVRCCWDWDYISTCLVCGTLPSSRRDCLEDWRVDLTTVLSTVLCATVVLGDLYTHVWAIMAQSERQLKFRFCAFLLLRWASLIVLLCGCLVFFCLILFYVFSLGYWLLPLLLWHFWFGVRKSIRPVETDVMRCWRGYLSGTRCRWLAYGPADTATSSSLASLKFRLV